MGRFVPRADGDADGPPWRWQEGIVLQAMREGHWLLLDEVNLAEPQILERLNSLLEREPSLVLTEHDHRRLAGGDIHPSFRLFATMNPAEYAGRSALSPAWRDRWRAHRVVPAPGEREIEQFPRASVFGEQPTIEVAGRSWTSARTTAPWASLARGEGIGVFLAGLARFHVSLDRALAQGDGPGRHRRDRYAYLSRYQLFAETLSRLQVPFAIAGFQDELIPVHAFDAPFDERAQAVAVELAKEVSGTRPGGRNRPAHNDDGPRVRAAAAELATRAEEDRVLVVLSDGRPSGRRSNEADLVSAVADVAADGLSLVGIGVGRGTEHVRECYPRALASVPLAEPPVRVGAVLRDVLTRAA